MYKIQKILLSVGMSLINMQLCSMNINSHIAIDRDYRDSKGNHYYVLWAPKDTFAANTLEGLWRMHDLRMKIYENQDISLSDFSKKGIEAIFATCNNLWRFKMLNTNQGVSFEKQYGKNPENSKAPHKINSIFDPLKELHQQQNNKIKYTLAGAACLVLGYAMRPLIDKGLSWLISK